MADGNSFSVNYHLATILERGLFICPPSGHDYRFIPDYIPKQRGLDSPLYRPLLVPIPNENLARWGVDDATAKILEDMLFMTSSVHAYMSGIHCEGYQECKDWFLLANRIQARILSLPQHSPITKTTPLSTIIYECSRLTAIIYCKAILTYTPFSLAWTPSDLDTICQGMIMVPCSRWKEICGTWLWMLCVVNPAVRFRYEGLRLRMFFKNCTSFLGLIDWQVLINMMESFLSVQRWIRCQGNRHHGVNVENVV